MKKDHGKIRLARELSAAAVAALLNGHKIEAIKIVRQQWGLGLKESKDTVETYLRIRPDVAGRLQEANAGKKQWLWLLFLLAAGALLYAFIHR